MWKATSAINLVRKQGKIRMEFQGDSSSFRVQTGRLNASGSSQIAERIGRLIRVIVCFVFALVGYFIGALTGGLIGIATESGLFGSAGIGGISGAVFSIEAAESVLSLWSSNDSVIWSILYMQRDILCSLLRGTLVREKIGPAVRSAIQSQIGSAITFLNEDFDIFETRGSNGMPMELVQNLPKTVITKENQLDFTGVCCVVCLQDFQNGNMARISACCQHIFHLTCIDDWLVRQGSCPLCRQDFWISSPLLVS